MPSRNAIGNISRRTALVVLLLATASLVAPATGRADSDAPTILSSEAFSAGIPSGRSNRKRLDAWSDLIERTRAMSTARSPALALDLVNQFFNENIGYEDDASAWGETDYWATPLETVTHGRGDCEDIAIAKYFTLLRAGLSPQRLKLHYVALLKNAPGGPAHVVLTYDADDNQRLVLDNLRGLITPLHQRTDLMSILEFDKETVTFVGGKPVGVSAWKRWAMLLERSAKQGLSFGGESPAMAQVGGPTSRMPSGTDRGILPH